MQASLRKELLVAITASIGLFACINTAKADLLAYEPFNGTVGANIIGSSGASGFASAWSDANNVQTATAVGVFSSWNLGYTDSFGNSLVTSPGSAFFQGNTTANSSWQGVRAFSFSRGTNDPINDTTGYETWVSMLMIRTGPTNGAVSNPYARGVNVVMDTSFGQAVTTQLQKIGVGNGSGAASNSVAILSSGGNLRPSANPAYQFGGDTPAIFITNLVILQIEHTTGGPLGPTDNVNMWVNPADLTSLGAPTTNVAGVYDYSFDRLRVFAGGNANATQRYGELYLDEYRVGESALDVLPVVPEPAIATIAGLGILGLLMYRRRK